MGESIAFFINSDKPEARSVSGQLMKIAKDYGFSCFVIDTDSRTGESDRLRFVATVGGDGTVLKAIDFALRHDTPILGINTGRVGFLTEFKPNGFSKALELYRSGKLIEEERMMLACSVNGQRVSICLNDMLLYKKAFSGVAQIRFAVDERDAGTVFCDGIIVGTPTGSTGYSISAGGPIIAPGLSALVITPVCPHSLLARPIVASAEARLAFTMQSEGSLYADGQFIIDVGGDDEIVITRAEARARFLRARDNNLFHLIKEKLS